jgi:type II secretory pathway component GspD/PulD (secretin)
VNKHVPALVMTIALGVTAGGVARAQQPAAPAAAAPAAAPVPPKEQPVLKVQVVISRYQGDKKISSQPYTLSVTPNARAASIRMGLQVAVLSSPMVPGGDGKMPPAAINYKDVGTSIDCLARSLDDGRFRLELTIDDSSLAPDDQSPQPSVKGVPQFRSFRIAGETAVLRDGQTTQLTTAAEKMTGEVAKVDVTLTVVK